LYWQNAWDISPLTGINSTFATAGGWGGGGGYSTTEKLFFTNAMAWDLSNPDQPPTIKWDVTNQLDGGCMFDSYGDGIVLAKSGELATGLDASTGEVVWTAQMTGGFSSYRGMYYDGLFYKGCSDRNLYAINATTGEIVWQYYDPWPYSNYCCGSAAAYGMVYFIGGEGSLVAFNAKTGEIVWDYDPEGSWSYYQGQPVVADGKVYATMPDGGIDPYTGEVSNTEFV
jgi:outer membrane protein assembly factor BamB